MIKKAILIANGDQRLAANQVCWAAQQTLEEQLIQAFQTLGVTVTRGHPFCSERRHGFIDSQRMGNSILAGIDPEAPLIVAEAVWQYSEFVLPGLSRHQGAILIAANWSGQHPGLVGALNLRACLTKMNIAHSFVWSADFSSEQTQCRLKEWIETEEIALDRSHVQPMDRYDYSVEPAQSPAKNVGKELGRAWLKTGRTLGVFDEGCMGMFNAIIPDDLLNICEVYKQRLSQSDLLAEMREVSTTLAAEALDWLEERGMKFTFGADPTQELTESQVLEQLKMYIAAVRIANRFGCDAIGIQYQQGLARCTPASDLAEGLLNNSERPPVEGDMHAGSPIPHFNEVDECAGLNALMLFEILRKFEQPCETTLHDLRYCCADPTGTCSNPDIWVFEISGAAPAAHFGGYDQASSERQPPMYFPQGGGTLRGISHPGPIVWSRIYVDENELNIDIGTGEVVTLPPEETERRWNETTRQWPIMHAVLNGVTRDQMMAKHQSNHVQVAYANSRADATAVAEALAAMALTLDIAVNKCGEW